MLLSAANTSDQLLPNVDCRMQSSPRLGKPNRVFVAFNRFDVDLQKVGSESAVFDGVADLKRHTQQQSEPNSIDYELHVILYCELHKDRIYELLQNMLAIDANY